MRSRGIDEVGFVFANVIHSTANQLVAGAQDI